MKIYKKSVFQSNLKIFNHAITPSSFREKMLVPIELFISQPDKQIMIFGPQPPHLFTSFFGGGFLLKLA